MLVGHQMSKLNQKPIKLSFQLTMFTVNFGEDLRNYRLEAPACFRS